MFNFGEISCLGVTHHVDALAAFSARIADRMMAACGYRLSQWRIAASTSLISPSIGISSCGWPVVAKFGLKMNTDRHSVGLGHVRVVSCLLGDTLEVEHCSTSNLIPSSSLNVCGVRACPINAIHIGSSAYAAVTWSSFVIAEWHNVPYGQGPGVKGGIETMQSV